MKSQPTPKYLERACAESVQYFIHASLDRIAAFGPLRVILQHRKARYFVLSQPTPKYILSALCELRPAIMALAA